MKTTGLECYCCNKELLCGENIISINMNLEIFDRDGGNFITVNDSNELLSIHPECVGYFDSKTALQLSQEILKVVTRYRNNKSINNN